MYSEPISMNTLMIAMIVCSLFFMAMLLWQREKRDQRAFEMNKMELEFEIKERGTIRKREVATTSNVNEINVSHDRYIVVEMDESQRQAFEDILIGFEDYAMLKGYKISVSFDKSVLNKLAFMITLHESSIPVDQEKIKWDMAEYFKKVQDDELEDIHEIIDHKEHQYIKKKLNNRINLVHRNNGVTKKSMDYFSDMANKITFVNSPQIFIGDGNKQLNGGDDCMTTYQANNSTGIVQGEGHKNISIDNSQNKTVIKVGKTYEEKDSQIKAVTELIALIKQSPGCDENEDAVFNLKTIEKELKKKEVPDAANIEECLQSVSEAFKTVEKGSALFTKASELFGLFNLSDLFSNIGN